MGVAICPSFWYRVAFSSVLAHGLLGKPVIRATGSRVEWNETVRIRRDPNFILGDPGATSRDNAIFWGERHFWRESLFQGLKSPWALTYSRSVEIRPADWPEKYFSGQSTRRSSRVILSPFYTKWFSSSFEREDFREEFQKKRFDEAEEITNRNTGASNTLPSILLADSSKVYRKTHECRVFLKSRNEFV